MRAITSRSKRVTALETIVSGMSPVLKYSVIRRGYRNRTGVGRVAAVSLLPLSQAPIDILHVVYVLPQLHLVELAVTTVIGSFCVAAYTWPNRITKYVSPSCVYIILSCSF